MTTLQFKIGFNPRGEYNQTFLYNERDTVFDGGNTYYAKADGITGIAPTNTNFWQLLAQGNLDIINSATDAPRSNARVDKIFSNAGQLSACSLIQGGNVVKRGLGANFNNGNGITINLPFANVGLPPSFANETITQIVGSQESNYLVTASGEVWFWGYNNNGQGGQGNTTTVRVPTKIQYFEDNGITIAEVIVSKGVDNIFGGNYENWEAITAYFLSTTGKLYGCGYNAYGQLAQGNTTQQTTPVPIEPTKTFTKISVSSNQYTSLFAIDNAGDLWAAGINDNGVLGLGNTTTTTTLTKVSSIPEAVNDIIVVSGKIESTSGTRGAFAIAKGVSGAIYTCGFNTNSQLGDGSTTQRTSFNQISLGTDNAKIFTNNGGYYGNAGVIKDDGSVLLWGANNHGQLGNGTTTNSSAPISIAFNNTTKVTKVVAAGTRIFTTFAFLFEDGKIETTGYATIGARGNGDTASNNSPTELLSIEKIVDLQAYGFGDEAGFVGLNDKGGEYYCGFSGTYYIAGNTNNTNNVVPLLIRH
jgi:alpha-tubulin suppressor-like RCC1 family protein